ncbi:MULTISPECIES: TAXI family TRAP transporter solute-binding subunit [Marinobacter]|uniref:TAXI family TRAP transporter solute-binding subunit n=1 Tax=Marinobacter TaxID=2742 RepID=UPI00124454D0|nr:MULTISPECIES: TAXI family TRAP transporter solute-binding subunit [Marinobacter]MBJ7275812.1 TAXI family TRAP transporter solute-binding subunit [Marinobacter salarius]MBL3558976.1 TAXI family TRAP transporter solute-binding subunit [Marinobacter sp. JB05H06]
MGNNITKQLFLRGAILALSIFSMSQWAMAQEEDDKFSLTVTGAGVQGYYKVVYETFNGILRDEYPEASVTFRPSSPAGGLVFIADGKADLSLAAGAPEIQYAIEGNPPYPRSLKGDLRSVMQLFNTQTFHFVLNKDVADEYGVYSFADIAKKKPPLTIAINRQGNLQVVDVAKDIFEAHGFSIEDLQSWGGQVSWVASGTGLEQLQDRKADMFMNVRFVPDARVNEIVRSQDLVWVEADQDALESVADKWGYEVITIDQSNYPELMDTSQPTITQWSALLAGPHVPDAVVYKFIKALVDNKKRVQQVHPSLKAFSAEEAVKIVNLDVPLHPGAERFYRELDLLEQGKTR